MRDRPRKEALMDAELMVKVVEEACPFARRSRIRVTRVAEEGYITAILEESEENLNAFGLIHAGAICGLAETAGGMALFNFLDPMEFIILNTVLNIRYVAMPRGELRCTARVVREEVDVLVEEFRLLGKADKAIDLKVLDDSGRIVARAQATYRLMATPEEFKAYFAALK